MPPVVVGLLCLVERSMNFVLAAVTKGKIEKESVGVSGVESNKRELGTGKETQRNWPIESNYSRVSRSCENL